MVLVVVFKIVHNYYDSGAVLKLKL